MHSMNFLYQTYWQFTVFRLGKQQENCQKKIQDIIKLPQYRQIIGKERLKLNVAWTNSNLLSMSKCLLFAFFSACFFSLPQNGDEGRRQKNANYRLRPSEDPLGLHQGELPPNYQLKPIRTRYTES